MLRLLRPICLVQRAQELRERTARKAREMVENPSKVSHPLTMRWIPSISRLQGFVCCGGANMHLMSAEVVPV